MKTSVRITVSVLLAAASTSTALAGNRIGNPELLVVGPVESIDVANGTATVLGQRVQTLELERLAVGSTVAVFGVARPDGSILASAILSRGAYVPGATSIFLSGTVDRAAPALGKVTINGVIVDLTSVMSYGVLSPAVGTKLSVQGTQPASHGVVLVSGTSTNGIAGTATNGIAGTGTTGIAGTGTNGIAGTGTNGIAGTGTNGIAGTGTNGIAGTGKLNGIAGTGTNGIAGTGTNGIAGTGTTGIAGTGKLNGIAGTGNN